MIIIYIFMFSIINIFLLIEFSSLTPADSSSSLVCVCEFKSVTGEQGTGKGQLIPSHQHCAQQDCTEQEGR